MTFPVYFAHLPDTPSAHLLRTARFPSLSDSSSLAGQIDVHAFSSRFKAWYLSALQSISEDLYESAEVDGANAWQKFFHISVPLLRPTTIYVLTISIYGGLAMFVESRMLFANTEVGNQALTIVGYLYRVGIRKMNYGLGSAIGIVLLVLTLIINISQLALTGFFRKE